jgi:hypothetical protein
MRTPQIVALFGVTIFATISAAQMRAPAMSMPGAIAPAGFGPGVGVSLTQRPHPHRFGPSTIFFGDPFYADYPTQPWPIQTPPPQVVLVQPTSRTDAPPEPGSEPLLIELQGNRYVRFGGRQQSAERSTNAPPDYAEEIPAAAPKTQHPTRPELPPAILIFRDGHREPIPGYAIVGATLYANGDYWQSGHWTRNIQLSALDLPATIQANHDAGINFTLPSAANEVITRP